jgi:hypothetical protein
MWPPGSASRGVDADFLLLHQSGPDVSEGEAVDSRAGNSGANTDEGEHEHSILSATQTVPESGGGPDEVEARNPS